MFPKTMRGHMLRILYETLEANGWSRSEASRVLCVSLTTVKVMIREMRTLGIVIPKGPPGRRPTPEVPSDDHP